MTTDIKSTLFKCCGMNYSGMECSKCHTANPNRIQPTLKRRRKIPQHINPKNASYLVCGYIRNIQKVFILDIAKLCIQFYDVTGLVYIGEVNNWFTSNSVPKNHAFKYLSKDSNHTRRSRRSSHKLNTDPLTQYIDDTYQIVHGQFQTGWKQPIPWLGWLCINMLTNEIHELKIGDNKFSHKKDSLILGDNKYLKVSEPLVLQSEPFKFSGTSSTAACFLTPKSNIELIQPIEKTIAYISDDDEPIPSLSPWMFKQKPRDLEPIKHNIWTQFYDNLWDLFITNRLYDYKQELKDQKDIWYIMQFLWILNDDYMKIPYIILNSNDLKAVFDGYNTYKDEKFNVQKDCNAEIIKYKKNEILECKCFMYYEHHYYMWGRSTTQLLQEVIFKICKTNNNKVDITFTIHTVFNVRKSGRF